MVLRFRHVNPAQGVRTTAFGVLARMNEFHCTGNNVRDIEARALEKVSYYLRYLRGAHLRPGNSGSWNASVLALGYFPVAVRNTFRERGVATIRDLVTNIDTVRHLDVWGTVMIMLERNGFIRLVGNPLSRQDPVARITEFLPWLDTGSIAAQRIATIGTLCTKTRTELETRFGIPRATVNLLEITLNRHGLFLSGVGGIRPLELGDPIERLVEFRRWLRIDPLRGRGVTTIGALSACSFVQLEQMYPPPSQTPSWLQGILGESGFSLVGGDTISARCDLGGRLDADLRRLRDLPVERVLEKIPNARAGGGRAPQRARAKNAFSKAGITTVGELLAASRARLQEHRNIGDITIAAIVRAVEQLAAEISADGLRAAIPVRGNIDGV
ncbi:MAG: DNA-directed RNA polymerase subunit alpha C-terminal domain-containing protein [Candidatus Omnitrophota bacterium]